MTEKSTIKFLEGHTHIDIRFDDDYAYCRNNNLPWYQADPDRCTRIPREAFLKMEENQLLEEINRGLNVVRIARVTGYFSTVESWNNGKLGELRDRVRVGDSFTSSKAPPS